MLRTTPNIEDERLGNAEQSFAPRATHWVLDPQVRQLSLGGQAVPLGERAFELLLVLARAPGRVVGTDSLLQAAWPGRVVEENNLHVHMAALRRVLGSDAIRTVRGQGYQLTHAIALPESALAPVTPASGGAAPTSAPAQPPAGNLPQGNLTLIGRDAELAALLAALGTHPI